MTRLSYARVLIEVDLLADLSASINLVLPNGIPLSQQMVYESLPRFYKQCQVLGYTTSICTKSTSHKRKKRTQEATNYPGCSSPPAEIAAMEKQQAYSGDLMVSQA